MNIQKSHLKVGDKVIVTTDNWFYAPDGQTYRAAFGTIQGIHTDEEILGIKTNSRSTNWYIVVGNLTIAGCQIHYAIKSDACSFDGFINTNAHEGLVNEERGKLSHVYNADGE